MTNLHDFKSSYYYKIPEEAEAKAIRSNRETAWGYVIDETVYFVAKFCVFLKINCELLFIKS